jgi:hypothetical protein
VENNNPASAGFRAERAGFEYYPLNGGARTQVENNNPAFCGVMAERAGFEPANPCGLHALQACALNQTTRPLQLRQVSLQRAVLYHFFGQGLAANSTFAGIGAASTAAAISVNFAAIFDNANTLQPGRMW